MAALLPSIHERLSPCKSNTQPLKDSFLHLKGRSFFLADAVVASLSSVHRLRAELCVRPAIHSGWRWTDNLTTSTRPMISSGAGGPFTERSEVGYPTTTKPVSVWQVHGREFCYFVLRRRSRRRDTVLFVNDLGRSGGSSRYCVSFLLIAYAVRQSSCPTRMYPRLRFRFPPSV